MTTYARRTRRDRTRRFCYERLEARFLLAGPSEGEVGDNSGAPVFTFSTLALTGERATGTPSGVVFKGLDNAALNRDGDVAFEGFAESPDLLFRKRGIWRASGDGVELVALADTPAPSMEAGVVFGNFLGPPSINGARETAFHAFVIGPVQPSANRGIWVGTPDNVTLAARSSQQIQNADEGLVVASFNNPHGLLLNSKGEVAFGADLAGTGVNPSNGQGLFLAGENGIDLIARKGDAAPGTPTDSTFFHVHPSALNDAGEVAFSAFLRAGIGPASTGAWIGSRTGLTPIAVSGAGAPDLPTGVAFSSVSPSALNNDGVILVNASLDGIGVDSTNDQGVWMRPAGDLALVVREGDHAPGTQPGTAFVNGFSTLLNQAGEIAFKSGLLGPGVEPYQNDTGIWLGEPGDFSLVVRKGDPAPGIEPGAVFGTLGGFGTLNLNALGQIAFVGLLYSPEVGFTDSIWIASAGTLDLVAREGDFFEVAPNDFREIDSFYIFTNSGNEDGRRSSFNDHGQLAFQVRFRDESEAIILASPAAIDLGDAPQFSNGSELSYPTLRAHDGARHIIVDDVLMGTKIDAELNGQPNDNATGDDFSGLPDEDGVIGLDSELIRGKSQDLSVAVTTPEIGYLTAWIDWNSDGDWNDVNERIVTDSRLMTGSHNIAIQVPEDATLGETFARFRFSTTPGLSPTGLAADGEVEDYAVTVGDACLAGGPFSVGRNRLSYRCATPGGFASLIIGTQTGNYHFEDYGVTVNIADPKVRALSVANIDGVATAILELTDQHLSRGLLFQAFEMLPNPRVSNVLVLPSRLDTNHDGKVSALDALIIIKHIGQTHGKFDDAYDANGDGRVSALDALTVINQLSRLQADTATGEPKSKAMLNDGPESSELADWLDDDLLRLLDQPTAVPGSVDSVRPSTPTRRSSEPTDPNLELKQRISQTQPIPSGSYPTTSKMIASCDTLARIGVLPKESWLLD